MPIGNGDCHLIILPVILCVHSALQWTGVALPHVQCSQDRLGIQLSPDQG